MNFRLTLEQTEKWLLLYLFYLTPEEDPVILKLLPLVQHLTLNRAENQTSDCIKGRLSESNTNRNMFDNMALILII